MRALVGAASSRAGRSCAAASVQRRRGYATRRSPIGTVAATIEARYAMHFNPTPLVLVVDDDARTARRLAQLLREDGYAVEVAGDGAAAVGRLSRLPLPDVLITELQLPHVDGEAVARYARVGRPNISVFFVTGYPQLAPARLGGPGADAVVFTKPLDYDALRTELDRQCTVTS